MALRKRNQTQQAEKNQNFKYHFHIPLSHTTAEIYQKVVYTTFFREMVNTGRRSTLSHSASPQTISREEIGRVRITELCD
jgi:hypothetical protein